ncbi:hypothetical protein R0J93_21160, partial [Pseudoalteromonas sp. SIMBA_148]
FVCLSAAQLSSIERKRYDMENDIKRSIIPLFDYLLLEYKAAGFSYRTVAVSYCYGRVGVSLLIL